MENLLQGVLTMWQSKIQFVLVHVIYVHGIFTYILFATIATKYLYEATVLNTFLCKLCKSLHVRKEIELCNLDKKKLKSVVVRIFLMSYCWFYILGCSFEDTINDTMLFYESIVWYWDCRWRLLSGIDNVNFKSWI